MNLQTFKSKLTILLVFGLVFGVGSAWGQGFSNTQVRFANPEFEAASKTYSLDVEMRSNKEGDQLFGMNVRFFYDAAKLSFTHLDDFQQGYDILGETPKALVGNSQSGVQMFKFYEAAAYLNTAVQLMDDEASVVMGPNRWVTYFTAHFQVNDLELDSENFAPSVVWDIKSSPKGGGYFRGSDGVVATLVEGDLATREESIPSNVEGLHFNWVKSNNVNMPYGHPLEEDAINLTNFSNLRQNQRIDFNPSHHQLLQNQPNPFFEHTKIEFYLPKSVKAKISIFDVTGRVIRIMESDFPAGFNAIQVDKDDLNNGADVFFYRLESADYVSPMKKMMLMTK